MVLKNGLVFYNFVIAYALACYSHVNFYIILVEVVLLIMVNKMLHLSKLEYNFQ